MIFVYFVNAIGKNQRNIDQEYQTILSNKTKKKTIKSIERCRESLT